MSKISVIIAHRNDLLQLEQTICSLGDDCEIIVVDDFSDADQTPHSPLILRRNCRFLFNEEPMGVGWSRHQGVGLATGGVLVFTDSHMIFPQGWEELVRDIDYKVLMCSKYVSNRPFLPTWFDGLEIGGAKITHFVRARDGSYNICHIEPMSAGLGLEPVPCVIGACYVMRKEWYHEIYGLAGLGGYGGDEQLLSWKTWLSGGEVLCNNRLPVIHLSQEWKRNGPPNYDPNLYLRNKLYVERIVMGDRLFVEFAARLERSIWPACQDILAANLPVIERKVDPDLVSASFGLQTIEEAIALAGEL